MERKEGKFVFWTASKLFEVRYGENGVFFVVSNRGEDGKLTGERATVAPTYGELLAIAKAGELWCMDEREHFEAFCNGMTQAKLRSSVADLLFIHEDKTFGFSVRRDNKGNEKVCYVCYVKKGDEKESYLFPFANVELLRFTEILKQVILPEALKREMEMGMMVRESEREEAREKVREKEDFDQEFEQGQGWEDEIDEEVKNEGKKSRAKEAVKEDAKESEGNKNEEGKAEKKDYSKTGKTYSRRGSRYGYRQKN